MNSMEQFDETSLPSKEHCFNQLAGERNHKSSMSTLKMYGRH